ncbi:MAG: aconitate hydratase, partial [Kiritimatiellae bacterium]|nr:aconitate hydratase [Kiritimatiellia bacterium]
MNRSLDSFTAADGRTVHYHGLARFAGTRPGLPYSIRVLLEAVLRRQGHPAFRQEHVRALAEWQPGAAQKTEVPFLPARVLLQDFTGVPCVVDLAALRSAMVRAGRDPRAIEPQIPVDLVIDHSVQVDETASPGALDANMRIEFERNAARYEFLRWGQQAFRQLRAVPPGPGLC